MKTFSLSFFSLFIVISGWSEDRPNIIILLADDLGWADLGYQGSEDIRSPHIDKLAKNGIRFTDGHVSASVCSPSRAGLMTGRYQQRFGHEANSPPPTDGMDLKQVTMADRLRKLGYRTGLIGKWHLGNQDEFYPTQRGFDYFYGLRSGSRSYFYNAQKDDKAGNAKAIEENGKQVKFDDYLTDVFGQKAIDFINTKDDKPFFLFHSFTAPHGPMHATEEDKEIFASIENTKRRSYAAMIWAMDRAIGNLSLPSKNPVDLKTRSFGSSVTTEEPLEMHRIIYPSPGIKALNSKGEQGYPSLLIGQESSKSQRNLNQ
jgi:hypothetical protein